jgi:cytosine/adenosine deaminase-related metal-dependent hydrolase
MQMSDRILVRSRWLVTDALEAVHEDAAVLIEDDRVIRVGQWRSLREENPRAAVLGDARCAVIPGLVNAHHHSHAVSGIQQGVSDDLLEPWILAWHAMRPADPGLDTLVSAGIQLGSGVTSVVEMMSGGGSARQFADGVRLALEAYDTAGLRAAFAPGVATRSHLVSGSGEDRRFIESLPADERQLAESLMPGPERLGEDDYFDIMEQSQHEIAANPRIDLWYGPPGPQWVSDECLQRAAEAAERWDCGIQTHVNESFYEKLHGPRFYGLPTMLHLERLGVLSPRFTIAHGTWLERREIEVMAETGAALSHNPGSNLRLRAGIAPFREYLARGVTAGIGMDATTLNENEDMFAEMRLALRLQCDPAIENPVPGFTEVLAAATRGGARLMGKQRQIGRLAPGYAADLVILDSERLTWPWVSPESDPLELIALRAQRRDVRLVMVAGEIVWRDGAPTRFDLQAAGEELAAQLAAEPFPHRRLEAVRALTPRLRDWYAAWNKPALEPWIDYSSRR